MNIDIEQGIRTAREIYESEMADPSEAFVELVASRFPAGARPDAGTCRRWLEAAIAEREDAMRGPDGEGDAGAPWAAAMDRYVDAVRGILEGADHRGGEPKRHATLKWYGPPKCRTPYVSYRNCAVFYVQFSGDGAEPESLRFLTPFKDCGYRWYKQKTLEACPAPTPAGLSRMRDGIVAAALDIDEAWRAHSARAKETMAKKAQG